MNKKGHYGGFVAAAAVSFAITKDPILSISGAWLGSFIPDVDNKKSHINSQIYLFRSFYKQIQKLAFKNSTTYNIFKHRGALTHSWLTIAIIATLYKYYDNSFLFGLLIGVFIHHILDMFTCQGLRYFYPLKTKLF
jgi:membrane-bound metal-dependent hydrolase YbcI (DUF457 family)